MKAVQRSLRRHVTLFGKVARAMRLEHVCDMELAYAGAFTLVQPYQSGEGVGFGIGSGSVSGAKIAGRVRWVNHPRRRSDQAMLAQAHGLITTEEGAEILFSWQGRATPGGIGQQRQSHQVLATLFEAEDARYQWLNHLVCIAEGRLHPETLRLELRIYACIPDV
jgi:Protein of unknown function (DUF3237)